MLYRGSRTHTPALVNIDGGIFWGYTVINLGQKE